MFTTELLIIPKGEKSFKKATGTTKNLLSCSCYTTALRKNLSTTEFLEDTSKNGISLKVSKKKKSNQQTAVFIKLIVLSYGDVLLSNFLPRLVAITHSQSLTIVLKRDRIIEQVFFNNQANCNKWISFVIGQLKGTNAILLIDSSIRLSRITKKTVKWAH